MTPMQTLACQLSPAVTKMIRMDHAHVMALFHKCSPDASDTVIEAAADNICQALEVHAQLEEEIFYPAVREAGVAEDIVGKSPAEHDEMRSLIERVRTARGRRDEQLVALSALMNAVIHHVADEETQMLPAAEMALGEKQLSELGARMTERRIELVKPRAGALAADMARAAPVKTAMLAVGALSAVMLMFGGGGRRRSGTTYRS